MKLSRTLLAALLVLFVPLGSPAWSQKLARHAFEDPYNGYSLRCLEDWETLPVPQRMRELGIIVKFDGEALSTKSVEKNQVHMFQPDLRVIRLGEKELEPVEDEDRTRASYGRIDVADLIGEMFPFEGYLKDDPFIDETKNFRPLEARHRSWKANYPVRDLAYAMVIDTWTFHLDDFDLALVYAVPEQHWDDFERFFEKSAKSLELIERKEKLSVAGDSSYEAMLAYHEQDAARIEGWRALPTPSRKFIIKTSSDNDRFLEEVIERLEASRELFEEDYPPPENFDHVSVVRVCRSAEEMRSYGEVPPGVGGWFSPKSTELVLYDAVDVDRNATYAVMTHEAFHQYCHFLFGKSEAHRWFDEGHGDYYGGVEFKRGKAKVTPQMPAGYDRLGVVREMVREGSYAPVVEHINFSHREWQTQGPTGVSCYAQSWSIIYMLRQGMEGKVHRKVWKPEYADIVPAYVETLNRGFREAYAELLEERRKEAEEEKRELRPDELEVDREDLDEERKEEIWKAAIEASWGKIDLGEFEENWTLYVKKYLD